MDLAPPRHLTRFVRAGVRTTLRVTRSLPQLTTLLAELRDVARVIERLATYAAQELPEVVYQLERVREQLTAIERKLPEAPVATPRPNGSAAPRPGVSRGERRSG